MSISYIQEENSMKEVKQMFYNSYPFIHLI